MVAFNFKAQWAQLVTDGIKRQTVRASLRAEVGDTLQLYTRGAGNIFYMSDSCCGTVGDYWRDLVDSVEPARRYGASENTYQVTAGLFALLDGFGEDLAQFMGFFRPGFSGWLYRWDVRVRNDSPWTWFSVFNGGLAVNGTRWQARSGAVYITRPAECATTGAIGLMRGIPADWVEVV